MTSSTYCICTIVHCISGSWYMYL